MTITRQDLEDAAKVLGIEFNIVGNGEAGGDVTFYRMPECLYWNPTTNKADLWDLAERCGMDVNFMAGQVATTIGCKPFTPHNHTECAEAVILAAAEIWRAKK